MAAAIPKPSSGSSFAITPHKVAFCVLVQVYAPPSQNSIPFPFSSFSQHNRFGIFLLSLTKECDGILEPSLDELIALLSEVSGSLNHWFCDHLMRRLTSFTSPDDLFNFFADLRGILGGSDSSVTDDDQILLDPNSNIGLFVRRCLLTFSQMPFEGICHLLTNVGMYCKLAFSCYPQYELSLVDVSSNDPNASFVFGNMDMETYDYDRDGDYFEDNKFGNEKLACHTHAGKHFSPSEEDFQISLRNPMDLSHVNRDASTFASTSSGISRSISSNDGMFLRTNCQVQGYLSMQADEIEKCGSSFPLNVFELILKKLQHLAPDLHRVHYLRYLNNLYHDDYSGALENLHRYFDYSAGIEGVDCVPPPSACTVFGRYEIALLCLGMMHFHLGHPRHSLEVLTEAVRVSQQHSDDTCLAYTLVAMSNLLSEIPMVKTSGVVGPTHGPVGDIGALFSVQQQLFLLICRSLKRSESLKLKRLVASIHLEMAKYYLTHVQRLQFSFGPKAPLKLKTNPFNAYKELQYASRIIIEFGDENSVMTTDGAFCSAWLKSSKKTFGSVVLAQENDIRSNSNASHFSAQFITIPGSVLQLVGSSYLARVVSWEMYGSATLAQINALVYATCFTHSSSLGDDELAYSKLIQYLATYQGYKDAFTAMRIAEDKFTCVLKSRILVVKLQLLHECALHRGHIKLAQQFSDELRMMASSATGADIELKTEATIRHARTLLAAKQYSQAASVAHSLFRMCFKYNMQVKNATVLLLLAEICKKSGNPELGIPYALASLSHFQSFNLDLLKASATLVLSELWLSLGPTHANKALSLLHDSFPMLLGQGGLELRSRAFITEAKCYLADPSFSVSENPEMVLEPLKQASDELQLLQYHEMASEAFYLMAIIHDKLGQIHLRDEAAASFRKHIAALEHPQSTTESLLSVF